MTITIDGTNGIDFPDASRQTTEGVVAVKVQKFTTSGTYTPDPKLLYAIVECVGGGGGGGANPGYAGYTIAGGGGGSGAYSRSILTAAQIGVSQTVTIGAGGAGATGTGNGTAGGTTSLGTTLVTAPGGGGGVAYGLGGSGGDAGTGDVACRGNAAPSGATLSTVTTQDIFNSPPGANSMLGGGAPGRSVGPGGIASGYNANANTGGGGSGTIACQGVGTIVGGNGGTGIIIITEFCGS